MTGFRCPKGHYVDLKITPIAIWCDECDRLYHEWEYDGMRCIAMKQTIGGGIGPIDPDAGQYVEFTDE